MSPLTVVVGGFLRQKQVIHLMNPSHNGGWGVLDTQFVRLLDSTGLNGTHPPNHRGHIMGLGAGHLPPTASRHSSATQPTTGTAGSAIFAEEASTKAVILVDTLI